MPSGKKKSHPIRGKAGKSSNPGEGKTVIAFGREKKESDLIQGRKRRKAIQSGEEKEQ